MNLIKGVGEYVQLVKNGIKNRDKIIEGVKTATEIKEKNKRKKLGIAGEIDEISDEAIAEVLRRKDICASCPFNSTNAARLRDYSSSLLFEHCTLCKCRIGGDGSKEYCLSCTCGAEVWNNNNRDLPPMEIKWGPFKGEINKTKTDE